MKFSPAFHRAFVCIILFFICQDPCFCQYTILGEVKGINDFQGYNVVLLSVKDSSILEGAFFIEERFELRSPYISSLLSVSSMGYNDTVFYIDFTDNNKLIEVDIDLKPATHKIDEAVIKKNVPIFTVEDSKIVMNVLF